MSHMTQSAGRRAAMWGLVALLCGISFLAALATGAGVYIYAAIAAENSGGIVLVWLAWMIAGFAFSVANTIWSAKLLKSPTARGAAPVIATSCLALLSFAILRAATA